MYKKKKKDKGGEVNDKKNAKLSLFV